LSSAHGFEPVLEPAGPELALVRHSSVPASAVLERTWTAPASRIADAVVAGYSVTVECWDVVVEVGAADGDWDGGN